MGGGLIIYSRNTTVHILNLYDQYEYLFLRLLWFIWSLFPPLLCLLLLGGLSLPATLTRVPHNGGRATGRSLISRLWGVWEWEVRSEHAYMNMNKSLYTINTVVSRVSADGCLNTTRTFGLHGWPHEMWSMGITQEWALARAGHYSNVHLHGHKIIILKYIILTAIPSSISNSNVFDYLLIVNLSITSWPMCSVTM